MIAWRPSPLVSPGGGSLSTQGSWHHRVRWKPAAAGAALLLAAVGLLLLRIGRKPVIYDEGLVLVAADRLLAGQVPYRDFWNTHPPAQIWVIGALFRLFGESMMVARLYDVAVKGSLAVVVFAWARRLGPPPVALAAFAACVLWLEYYGLFGYTVFPALLLALVALALAVRALESGRAVRLRLFAAGLITGLAALFRLDFAGYVAATIVVLAGVALGSAGGGTLGARRRGTTLGIAAWAAGAMAPPLAVLVLLRAQGVTLARLFATLVVYPTTVFAETRRLPVPAFSPRTLVYHVPVWLGAAGLVWAARLAWRRRDVRAGLPWLALSLLLLFSLPQARTRADLEHQMPVLLLSLALAAGLWFELWRGGGALRRATALLAAGTLALTYAGHPIASLLRIRAVETTFAHGLPRAKGVALDVDQAAALRAVRESTRPADSLYVGLGRHDRARFNDALFYFLAERRYATGHHNLLPGLVTRADVQQEMISELRASRPPLAVLCTTFDETVEPNRSRQTGSPMLDDYVRSAYALSQRKGNYQIWVRREASMPRERGGE